MKEQQISEKMAACMTDAWLAGLVTKAFISKNSDYKEIASHLFNVGALDKLLDNSFNNEPSPFSSIVNLCKEALFYVHKQEIAAYYGYRFDWPTYEYITNIDN